MQKCKCHPPTPPRNGRIKKGARGEMLKQVQPDMANRIHIEVILNLVQDLSSDKN